MKKLRPLLVFGTRPEAVKMAPICLECQRRSDLIDSVICVTGQHSEMLLQVLQYFHIDPDIQLDVMRPNQTLAGLTARCLESLDEVLQRAEPDCVVAQGDTTSVMAASLAAFYRRIPFVHVEAGLRTGNLLAPWPEELNRRIADMATTLYCAPTRRAAEALLAEGACPQNVHVTGNTVVDALLYTVARERRDQGLWRQKYAALDSRPMILVTAHRRESFGAGFERICRALSLLAERFADHMIVYPVHLNPNVQKPVRRLLGDKANVLLTEPASYPEFVWLMDRSTLILTDSGGVQEEAPSLRKPVLVMRETTERPEAVDVGVARLGGTSVEGIVEGATQLLTDPAQYAACQIDQNPFGDGTSARRIVDLMLQGTWRRPE